MIDNTSGLLCVLLASTVIVAPAWAEDRIDFGRQPGRVGIAHAAPGSSPLTFGFCGEEPDAGTKGIVSAAPICFWIDRAPGNYRVTATLGGDTATRATIKAELRRLMVHGVAVPAGGSRTVSFTVNVRTPEIVGGGAVRLKAPRETTQEAAAWDRRLTLEFNGDRPAVRSIAIAKVDVPTIYLLGDSTSTDQSGEPYASWGQMLTAMVEPGFAVANHGESGESVSSAASRGRFAKVLGEIRAGDVFVVQFGHNDMKALSRDPQAATKYRDTLIEWIEAVRAKGASAVVVTPMNRHSFRDGRLVDTLATYPDMARDAARRGGAALIDLTARSRTLYETFGDEPARVLFKQNADGTGRDSTHHSPFGAYELARIVAADLTTAVPRLRNVIKPAFRRFDPARPDAAAAFNVPPSPTVQSERPLGDDAYVPAEARRR